MRESASSILVTPVAVMRQLEPGDALMPKAAFSSRLNFFVEQHRELVARPNPVDETWNNGWYKRYQHPVLTADHVPIDWRYDLDERSNPRLLERLGVNSVFNSGAIELDGKVCLVCLVCRVEGVDRKSFFAIAESVNGVDRFEFWPEPILLDEFGEPDTNVYDMRLVAHADGFIYGTFCTERRDPRASRTDTSSAVAACGIVRTRDLRVWQRLPDLLSRSPQQRTVVLHPEFVNGGYALYTRPQDGFIETGSGGGIAWALCEDIARASIDEEVVIDPRAYHTIREVKNGMGAAPIKTQQGWLHVAHGVRNTAAGLRYVLYSFLCALDEPQRVIAAPGGYFMAPRGDERIGDVSNVVFCNGLVARKNGSVFIYYGASDTRTHVATTDVDTLLDYVLHTPPDPLTSRGCVLQRLELIRGNRAR